MNVVLVCGFFDEQFVYREHAYATYFREYNINYTILTSTRPLIQKKIQVLSSDTGKFNIIRKPPFFQLRDFIIFWPFGELNKISPHVIHLFDAQQGICILAAFWAVFNKVPIVYDHELQRKPNGKIARLRYNIITRPSIKFLLRQAKIVRTVTPASFNLLKSIYPPAVSKIKLRSLGYIENEMNSLNTQNWLPQNKVIVSMTGYFDITKMIKPIVAALYRLIARYPNILFVIVGPVEDEKCKKYFSRNPGILHVNKLLNQNELNYVLHNSKISIWPKSTATIFEAMQFGNFIILPSNDQTTHLNSKQIHLLETFTWLTIEKKISQLMVMENVIDHSAFNYKNIVQDMITDYQNSL